MVKESDPNEGRSRLCAILILLPIIFAFLVGFRRVWVEKRGNSAIKSHENRLDPEHRLHAVDVKMSGIRGLMNKWNIAPWNRPVRWVLRTVNVVNVLATGALVVIAGAAASVIGIAEVQIGSGRGGSVDIWGDNWVCFGLIAVSIGLACLFLALFSSYSQMKARREFPDLIFEVVGLLIRPGPEPDLTRPLLDLFFEEVLPHDLFQCVVRVSNRESRRNASLEFSVHIHTENGDILSRPTFADRIPWTIAPGGTDQRTVTFVTQKDVSTDGAIGQIEVVDHNSGRRVLFSSSFGEHSRSTWEFL
jgi:hypothetical protein